MAETTNIAWTDHSFNPWVGCTNVSEGWVNCYAKIWAKRFGLAEWGDHPRHRTSVVYWRKPRKWARAAAASGLNRRRQVFCASLADVFDNQVPDQWHDDVWSVIRDTPVLDLLLTKRPQNIEKMLPPDWPLPNVWLGVTAENQAEADRRLPLLLRIPAVVHFASVEPQLEPVDLRRYLAAGLHRVIVGGESASADKLRPFDPDWARSLRDECRATRTAFFMKQLAGSGDKRDRLDDLPVDLQICEWPVARKYRVLITHKYRVRIEH